jgi:hypothetical protein
VPIPDGPASGTIGEGEIEESEAAEDGPPPGIESDRRVGGDRAADRRRIETVPEPQSPPAQSVGSEGPVRRYRLDVSSVALGTSISKAARPPGAGERDAIVGDPKVTTKIGLTTRTIP